MNTQHRARPERLASRRAWLYLLAILSLPAAAPVLPLGWGSERDPAPATAPVPCPPLHSGMHVATASAASMAPLAEGSWWQNAYHSLSVFLGNQRRMVQACTIGMVLALFIIWWRK